MELMTYKTRAVRTLSLLILVALLAALNPPSLTDSSAFAQTATVPELDSSADTANQVDLSWTAVTGADDYELWRWETSEGWVEVDDSIEGTSYSDTGVTAGNTYYYQVSADGGSTWSNRVNETVGAYDASALTLGTVTSSMISLSWTTVTGAASYELWRYENSWTQVGGTLTGTSYTDSSVEIGKTYYYQVMAKGTAGDGAWSNRVNDTVPTTTPGMPLNLNAAAGDAEVILTWDTPATDGGEPITGYEYRSQMAGGTWSGWMATSPALSRTATVSSLTNESNYNFEVQARNSNGAGPVATASAMPMSTIPATPPNLRATPSGPTVIELSWDAVPGATGYAIQRRVNSGTWESLSNVSGTSHTDSGLDPSTMYDYEVSASNAAGSSPWSGTVTATTQDPQAPAAPTLMASATGFTITLTWTAPDNGGADITAYEIESSPDGSTWTTLVPAAAATATSYTDASLPGGTVKHYQIRAVNSVGDGAWSASVMAAVAPAAPTLEAEAGYREVILTWTQGGDAPVTSYRVDKLDAQSNWAMEASLPGSTTPLRYRDTGLADSTVHTYRIIAINAAGESGESNSADATTLAQPVQAPGMPTSLAATSGPGMVTLTWAVPLFNGGVSVSEYQYRYREAPATATAWGSGGWMSASEMLTVEVKPLKPGTEYEFQVRALNSPTRAGEPATLDDDSTPELIAARTPGATGPTAVPVLRATLGTHAGTSITTSPHLSNATITLSWDALGGAAQNGGSPITGYEICYKKSTASAWMVWDAAGDAFATPSLNGAVYSAVHGADVNPAGLLDPGTTYQYRARALNTVVDAIDDATGDAITPNADCTHWDGDWSAVVSATTGAVEPEAPILHTADGTEDTATTPTTPAGTAWDLNVNSITIRWTAPATNGGADVTSYEVWVGTATVTAADDIAALSPTVTNLPAVRLEYISVGLTASREYFYRVRARNGSGNDRVSVWSAEQSGMTTATQAGTPGAPTTLAGSETPANSGTVPLTWTGPTDEGDSPITHYEVQYQRDDDDDDDDWSDATTVTSEVTSWTHMDAPGASTMEYRVRAVNASGAGAWSDDDGVDANGRQPERVTIAARAPSAAMLTATSAGTDEILLEWNTPQDNGTPITGYAIQRWDPTANSNAGAWDTTNAIAIDDADATVHSDIGDFDNSTPPVLTPLMAGTTYYYRIQATTGGTPGVWSSPDTSRGMVSATTDQGVPEMPVLGVGDGDTNPTGFPDTVTLDAASTAPTIDTITLYWTEPGDGGSDITGYELRVWDGSTWVTVASPAADDTSYAHEDLAPGTRYYYVLRASNAIGNSDWSADVSGMTTGGNPDAPELTAMATSSTSVRLTWTVPAENGTPITGYQLVRWNNADPGAWGTDNLLTGSALANTDAETVTEFVDTGLTAGTKYYYRIRALPQPIDTDTPPDGTTDDEGWSADDTDDATSVTTPGNTLTAPGTPTVSGTPTANSITFTWTEATVTAGGPEITGYDVQIWDGSMWVDEASLGVVLTYTDNGLMAGTRYYYRVGARNSQGLGPWSAYVAIPTAAAAPDAPVLTATAQGMNAIRLTWTVPDDNGTPITGYQLQRWDSTTNAWPVVATGNLLGDSNTATLFVDEGLAAGTRYHYRVRAMPQVDTPGSASGTDDEGWSVSKSATTVAGRPGKPVLTATADGSSAINLTWTAAAANGNAIVRYELQRWDTDARTWVNVHNALPSTRRSYRHSSLTAETRYVYRIRAVNRAADNGGNGYWSTIKFATTAE